MSTAPTLARVIGGAADALLGLRGEIEGVAAVALLAEIGLTSEVPPAALRALGARLDELAAAAQTLYDAVAADQPAATLVATLALGATVATTGAAVLDLELSGPDVVEDVEGALAAAGRRIFDRFLVRGLRSGLPAPGAALDLAGVLDRIVKEGPSPQPDEDFDEPSEPHALVVVDELRTDRVERALSGLGTLAGELYGMGTADLDAVLLLERLDGLARRLGFASRVESGSVRSVSLLETAGAASPVRLAVDLTSTEDGSLVATVRATGDMSAGAAVVGGELVVDGVPDGIAVTLAPGAAAIVSGPSGTTRVTLRIAPPAGFHVLRAVGPLDATAAAWWLECALDPGSAAPLVVLTGLDGLVVALDMGAADAFLSGIFGSTSARMDLAASWSPSGGVALEGSIEGLNLTVPLEIRLGPLTIHSVTAEVEIGPTTALRALFSLSADLGVIAFSAAGIGAEISGHLSDGAGNAGLLEIDPPRIVPPSGVGIAVDAGVASGGGFLYLDPDAGEYAGVFELQVLAVGISAVGLIETQAPGVDGWSVFLALFLDLPSIQLGFGFTLTGVGGLAGMNRTLDADALSSAVRSGSLDAVLFPQDPVADAPEVIATLGALFPAADGRVVFGPVVRFGWGTPSLVEAEIGFVVSLPDPITIAVIGSLTSVLPTAEVDLVALRLDVAGVVDFGAATLAIDASLHDSHVVGFALSGDMAIRASFGDPPTFLMALGGFHPGFDPPPGFPSLRRLALALAVPAIDVRLECYFALASNSVQFGAALHISAEVAGFGIDGGTEFDALIGFNPFVVSTHAGFHVCVTGAGIDLAGVWLEADVDCPNPWHIVGTASFKILGLEEHIRIDERIGSARAEQPPPPVDLLDALVDALSISEAWSTRPSPSPGVVLVGDATPPEGVVAVSQGVVPLAISLDKAGEAPLGDYDLFLLEPTPRSLEASGDLREWFAPGYFFTLGAGEKLSTPSFELLSSGLELGGGPAIAGPARECTLAFEQILRDPELDEERVELGKTGERFEIGGKIATAAGSGGIAVAVDDNPVTVAAGGFVLVDGESGDVRARAATWSAVHQIVSVSGVIAPAWEVAA